MNRKHFAADAAAFLALACTARAAYGEEPAAAPAGTVPPFSQLQRERKHVHGIDAGVNLPGNRPIDWSLPVLDGPDFHLAAYRGRVVFLNVFATWCEPCRKEQPDMVAFAAAHPDDTVVVGIADGELDDIVRRYRKVFGIAYPIATDRYRTQVHAIYRKNVAYPATVVIRPDGFVSCAWVDDCDRAWLENERRNALFG